MFAGTGGLNRSIQGQQIGLLGQRIDDFDGGASSGGGISGAKSTDDTTVDNRTVDRKAGNASDAPKAGCC